MRSTAHFRSHPIHPALVPFPFAFLTGATLFDLAGALLDQPALYRTASHLVVAGLFTGVAAAVPGAIDYLHSVPPRSSARARARRHGVGNLTAIVLFAAGAWFRDSTATPGLATLACEVAGAGALSYAGWLGGTLVTRNLISVDHRYANAGKWQEERYSAVRGQPVVVGRSDDMKVDQMKLLHVNGRRIVLARTVRGYAAFDDRCTHRGGSLAGGVCVDGTVQCLWHGAQFDARTGEVRCGPARTPIEVYDVSVADGQVRLAPADSFFSRSEK